MKEIDIGNKDRNILAQISRPKIVQINKAGLKWDNNFVTWPEVQLSCFLDNCKPQATTETMTNLVSKTFLAKEEESYYIEDNYANFEEGDRKSTPLYYLKDLEISAF